MIAATDVIAMGDLCKVDEVGLSVTDEIAIVGYDDIPAARLLSPSLTTVDLHPERIGAFRKCDSEKGAEVVVEASGSPAGLDLAGKFVKAHGVLLILGYHLGERTQVDVGMWD